MRPPLHFLQEKSDTITMTPLRIAVLGTGLMGLPMARRLRAAGHPLQAWNRTRAKAEPLLALGATVHPTPAEAVQDAQIVISMLENGPGVGEGLVYMGTRGAMRKGALFIDMASIQPGEARDHAARLAGLGLDPLDAPVSGGTVGAEAGQLAIMVGGNAEDFRRAQPVFAPLGRATHVGPHGAGQLAKLANQMIVGITIGAVAEALLFAAKGGADMALVCQAIQGGFADSRIALATAKEAGFDAPITTMFETLYAQGVAHGLGELDHSGIFVELANRNPMPYCLFPPQTL